MVMGEGSSRQAVLQNVVCAEMEARTRLVCDALTSFQRIVGLCVAERHGRWAVFFDDERPRHGWSCPECGYAEADVDTVRRQRPRRTPVKVFHERLTDKPCVTPLCDEREFQGKQPYRCRYASEAEMLLDRRHVFQEEYGPLLQRIQLASERIQESVTR
ncbi:hypothetical protein JKF63_00129 [Porcisia hertigi]|uniref:Uncharacterized protein n=1 Tax=Porcisia hertigi TaxID=2761500 RepID=A0A836L0T3_9TRYP|nr:hypothetical protein JKF63_00129 [Porcisia hertigi]